jgi:hypothetical protein
MILQIFFRDTRIARIAGVTSIEPEDAVSTILDGYYRDIFALDAVVTGLNYPGTEEAIPKTANIPIPALLSGGIVPYGPVSISRLENDTESKLSIGEFKVAVSDEIAHEPLRQVQYQESYWAFPFTIDAVDGYAYFRKSVVDGWGPEPPTT